MTVLIDSWAWIAYFKGGKHSQEAMRHIESEEEAVISTINLIEIYASIAKSYTEAIAAEKIKVVEKRCYLIPVEKEIAVAAAKLKLKHRLGIADSIVLSTAKQFNAKVVTGDPDFKSGVEGVLYIGD